MLAWVSNYLQVDEVDNCLFFLTVYIMPNNNNNDDVDDQITRNQRLINSSVQRSELLGLFITQRVFCVQLWLRLEF